MSEGEKEGLGFWSGLMRGVIKHHSQLEIEEHWASGTVGNIPSISRVDVGCPRPWLFVRMFAMTFVIYILFNYLWKRFYNPNMLPGLMFIGTCVVPLCALVFFFELNARRNVSIFQVGRILVLGGALSLLFALFMFKLTGVLGLGWMGASVAGIAEETAKFAAVLIMTRSRRYPYILNGLLFGAAVGTGFAIYESAGYALNTLIMNILTTIFTKSEQVMAFVNSPELANLNVYEKLGQLYVLLAKISEADFLGVINLRGMLSPFGHIVWTAIAAGGFWWGKGNRDFKFSLLFDLRFIGTLLISVLLHAVWNCKWNPNVFCQYDKYILLGVLGWIVVLAIARKGFRQLAEEKAMCADENNKSSLEDGVKETIQIQTVYVEKLVSQEPLANPLTEGSRGYDHLGVEAQVASSKEKEASRERPRFSGAWYDEYRRSNNQSGNADKAETGGGNASRRRWEKYMKNGDDGNAGDK